MWHYTNYYMVHYMSLHVLYNTITWTASKTIYSGDGNPQQYINVSVENINYTPISFSDIKNMILGDKKEVE